MGPKTRSVVDYVRANPGASWWDAATYSGAGLATWHSAQNTIRAAIKAGHLIEVDGHPHMELYDATQCGMCGRSDHELADALADGSMCHPEPTEVPAVSDHPVSVTPAQAEAERERLILAGSSDPLVGRGPVEDAPRYAWTVEGEVTSGTLERYQFDYKEVQYGGMSIGLELWDGSGTREVWIGHISTDSDDYMHYVIYVRESGETGRIVDWAYMTIDGRA